MDHRHSRCVSGLSIGSRPVSASTTRRNAAAAHQCATEPRDRRSRSCVADRAEVCAARAKRHDREHEQQERFDERREGQVAACAHQGKAASAVPACRGRSEARECEHADEHDRIGAERPAERVARDRDEHHSDYGACGDRRGGEPVDEGRAVDVDDALAPRAPEFAIRLEGDGPGRPSFAFTCWTMPGNAGARTRPATCTDAAAMVGPVIRSIRDARLRAALEREAGGRRRTPAGFPTAAAVLCGRRAARLVRAGQR